jgi:hypothetical protein
MDDESGIDWTDPSEVGARIVEQFGVCLAQVRCRRG